MRRFLLLMSLAGGLSLFAHAEAKAQFLVTGPGGSLGIQNPNGTYTFVYPDRLKPSANVAQPGTFQQTPFGNMWLGADGQVHGNLVDSTTGDVHLRAPDNRSARRSQYQSRTGGRQPQNSGRSRASVQRRRH